MAGRTVWTLTQSDSTSYLLIRVRVGLVDAGSGGTPEELRIGVSICALTTFPLNGVTNCAARAMTTS